MNATTTDIAVARVRIDQVQDGRVVVGLVGTNYQLHLVPSAAIATPVGKRARGVIRADVWKVDFVSTGGGAYVEPIIGTPRRIQGKVVGQGPGANSVVVDVSGTPFVGDLPARWPASQIKPGTRVGLDVHQGARFEPAA